MTYSHHFSWLVLAAIMAAGVLIRHFFNLRHAGKLSLGYPVAGMILLMCVAIAIAPPPRQAVAAPLASSVVAGGAPAAAVTLAPDVAAVHTILTQRCTACHSASPTQAGFASAPGGVMLDSESQVRQHAAKIYQRAVQSKDMPLANMTHMTDDERRLVADWFEAGAK
jgi:uncharacterized membrane protein